MKTSLFASLRWVCCLWVLLSGCKYPETVSKCDCCQKAYVIGYDPCTAKSIKGIGFVLALSDSGDTLVTYNLPDSLYQFAPNLFRPYQLYYLFPIAEQKKYPLLISYHLVSQDKKTIVSCSADINLADFIHTVRGREIVIDCARRTDK